mgnify:CR=1 FL=1
MRRVIDGKAYDTRTADLLAVASYRHKGDFRAWAEELYQTPGGRYFLAGHGGPLSEWVRKSNENVWYGGSGIRVLTEAEALGWVGRWAPEEYKSIFGPAEEA